VAEDVARNGELHSSAHDQRVEKPTQRCADEADAPVRQTAEAFAPSFQEGDSFMRLSTRPALALLASLALLVALPAAAEPKEWDQAAVTELAQQLAEAAGDLRQSVRRTPPPPVGSQRRVRFQALDDLRVAENAINNLARRLESGEGREETYPTFERIRTLRNDIARLARRANITEPTLSKLETARGLLEQLAPYYEAEETDEVEKTG
jgi:hypothetical protein